jgi:hypothetical protein
MDRRLTLPRLTTSRAVAAVFVIALGALAASTYEPEKAGAIDGCWWYTNAMGRDSNCDGLSIYDKPECIESDEIVATAQATMRGALVATVELHYQGDPCRTVLGMMDWYVVPNPCYLKVARTQSGGGEKAVYGERWATGRTGGLDATDLLYVSGRQAYAWIHCQLPDGSITTARTPNFYVPPA